MRVRPGTPDDDNREYLPEKIKNSDIVVNENGNNSQPYPERLKEYREVLADGVEDIWYEYVPEGYDPSKKTPLVVSMHGGLMTGWGQAIYTSWTMVADRDNVIIVFPNASFHLHSSKNTACPMSRKETNNGSKWISIHVQPNARR